MIEFDWHDTQGGHEQLLPAGYVYARTVARHLGYGPEYRIDPYRWRWSGPASPGSIYIPEITGTPVTTKVGLPSSVLSLVFPEPGGITCRMYGHPLSDDALFALIGALDHLPYGHETARAIIDQADWLDANPQYRGLRIAQGAKPVHVDDIGPSRTPTFAGYRP